MAKRYGELSIEEIDDQNKNIDNPNTLRALRTHVDHFRRYLRDKNIDDHFENHENSALCSQLKLFLANARTKQGELYKLNTFNQMVFALKRHLQKHDISIDGEEFVTLKETVATIRKRITKAGKGKTNHKESISNDDLKTLYSTGMSIIILQQK